MAFVETFALSTGVATTTQSRTGYGFQPVAAVFIAADQQAGSTMCISRGAAVSASSRICVDWVQQDNTTNAVEGDLFPFRSAASVVRYHDESSTLTGAWDLDSFDSDGLTLIVDTQNIVAGNVTVIAWSADEVLDSEIVDWSTDASTGDTDITGSTIGSPNLALHFGLTFFGASTRSGLGNAISALAADLPTVNPTNAHALANDVECTASVSTTGSVANRGRVTAWLSNGFTHTVDEGGSSIAVYSLMLRVPAAGIGTVQTETSLTTFNASSPVNTQSLLFCSASEAEDSTDSSHADARFTMGVCDGSLNQGCIGFWSEDGVDPTDVNQTEASDAVYRSLDVSAGTLDGEFSVSGISGTNLSFSMDDAESGQAFVWFVAIGTPIARGAPIFF